MAEQYLSDFAKPTINGNVAQRIFANEILRGVAQGIIETNGEGITQRFSNDVSGAQIRITKMKTFGMLGRELGATLYGENFDGTAIQPETVGLGVDVITVINQNIDIADVTQDMIPVNLLAEVRNNLAMDINNNINAMTVGGKMVSCFNAVKAGDTALIKKLPSSPAGDDYVEALLEMGVQLDEGDSDNGLSYFPDDDRCYVVRPSIVPALFKKGAIIIGGSDTAQRMYRDGVLSDGAKKDIRTGYIGDFNGVSMYKATPLIWNIAAKYAGVPTEWIADIVGYLSSGYANVRALAQTEQVKVIDCPNGAGVRLQPNFRMGFKALYPKGNVFLAKYGYVAPTDSTLMNKDLTLKAPKSRKSVNSLTSIAVGTVTATLDTTSGEYQATITTGNTGVITLAGVDATATSVIPDAFKLADLSTSTYTKKNVYVVAEDGTLATYVVAAKKSA